MKHRLILIIGLALTIIMTSCPNPQPQEKDVAKTIWEDLLANDSAINASITGAIGFNENEYVETQPIPQFLSDTHMKFYHIGDESEGQTDQLAYLEMQCYPMKDRSWIAVVFEIYHNYDRDDDVKGLRCFQYKKGQRVNDNPPVDLPAECPESPMDNAYCTRWDMCAIDFDSTGFVMVPYMFWPIRYDWNGEKFTRSSPEIANEFTHGDLATYDFSRRTTEDLDIFPFKVDKNYRVTNDITGEEVVQLEFEDEHLSAVEILSPRIGFACAADEEPRDHSYYYLYFYDPYPIALGQPIQNVYDCVKGEPIYEEITASNQDGLYTLTQHLKVDKSNHKDVYAVYQAKDKDGTIERFRIVGMPLQITLESEVSNKDMISEEAKALWFTVNTNNAVTKNMPGSFKQLWDYNENGFAAIYREENDHGGYVEWKLIFARLAVNDGREIALVRKIYYDRTYADMPDPITPEWEQYVCQDGQVQQVEPQLPEPQLTDFPAVVLGDHTVTIDGENSSIAFSCAGRFSFFAHSDDYSDFGDPWPDANWPYYNVDYRWDGETFTPDPFDYDDFYSNHERDDNGNWYYTGDYAEDE